MKECHMETEPHAYWRGYYSKVRSLIVSAVRITRLESAEFIMSNTKFPTAFFAVH